MSEIDAVRSWLLYHRCTICLWTIERPSVPIRLCPEAEAMLAERPAVEHVRASGAAMLPGMDDVPAADPQRVRGWEA